jgi:hypothetical protein
LAIINTDRSKCISQESPSYNQLSGNNQQSLQEPPGYQPVIAHVSNFYSHHCYRRDTVPLAEKHGDQDQQENAP